MNQEEKQLRQKGTDLMIEATIKAETKILQYRESFNKGMHQISLNDKSVGERFSSELMELIRRHLNISDKQLDYSSKF